MYRDSMMVAAYGCEFPITSQLVVTAAKTVYIMFTETVPYVPSRHHSVECAHTELTQVALTH